MAIDKKWTSVSNAQQAASEAIQTPRIAEQIAYNAAQGPNRNAAVLSSIEATVGARSGGKVLPPSGE